MKREIPCETCGGKGLMPLPGELADTLGRIPKSGATTGDLQARMPTVSPTAQINRLERLRELGFLIRAREGKFYRYYKIEPKFGELAKGIHETARQKLNELAKGLQVSATIK